MLRSAVKEISDTMEELALPPTRLGFGVIEILSVISIKLPDQKKRMEIIDATKAKRNNILEERRITTALTKHIPSEADQIYEMVEEELVQ